MHLALHEFQLADSWSNATLHELQNAHCEALRNSSSDINTTRHRSKLNNWNMFDKVIKTQFKVNKNLKTDSRVLRDLTGDFFNSFNPEWVDNKRKNTSIDLILGLMFGKETLCFCFSSFSWQSKGISPPLAIQVILFDLDNST